MSDVYIWGCISGLFLATFVVRFSFFGLFGDRPPGRRTELMLRYVPSAVLPALLAPMVFIKDGSLAPVHMIGGATAALAVGLLTRHILGTLTAGVATYHVLRLLGF